MEEQLIIQAAEQLMSAQKTGEPTEPVRTILGTKNVETAYRVQHLISQLRIDHGAKKIGSKIGLTSLAVQQQLGVDQPDYGSLFDDMMVESGSDLSFTELMQPKAEAEIAFVLKEDLNHDEINLQVVSAAIDHAVAAIEIVGSRVRHWDIRITDTIADNASASHFVLGHQRLPLGEIDLVHCGMQMQKNGSVVSEGTGEACLGNPLTAVVWLAQTMKEHGEPLKAGDIILSGALGPMTNLEAGDYIEASIEGLGTVSLRIT